MTFAVQAELALRAQGPHIGLTVWGRRGRCGWASLFSIVDADVSSEVCSLFFRLGQPDALAWSRFDEPTRARVRQRYVQAIEAWRTDDGYGIPGEFVVLSASTPLKAVDDIICGEVSGGGPHQQPIVRANDASA